MSKIIEFEAEARAKLKLGVDKLANAVMLPRHPKTPVTAPPPQL
jgi:hypothetical protein